MSEINVISRIWLGIGLFVVAWKDHRTKQISLRSVILLAMGILPTVIGRDLTQAGALVTRTLFGSVSGFLLWGLQRMWPGAVGMGDVWVFLVCGMYLGCMGTLGLLWLSMILAMVAGAVLLLGKNYNRKTKIPFIPFVFLAYVLMWIGGII